MGAKNAKSVIAGWQLAVEGRVNDEEEWSQSFGLD